MQKMPELSFSILSEFWILEDYATNNNKCQVLVLPIPKKLQKLRFAWYFTGLFLLTSTGLDEENNLETRKKVVEILEELILKIC